MYVCLLLFFVLNVLFLFCFNLYVLLWFLLTISEAYILTTVRLD